jgi:hypothetical protein
MNTGLKLVDTRRTVKSRSGLGLERDWKPPECIGWTAVGFTTLVTTAARFHHDSGAEGLLRRVGPISELAGVRYWSTTHKRWRTLVVDAYALTALQGGRRADFTSGEMKEGSVLYFEQEDNLSGRAVYRMRIVEASPDRLVIDVQNVRDLDMRAPLTRRTQVRVQIVTTNDAFDAEAHSGCADPGLGMGLVFRNISFKARTVLVGPLRVLQLQTPTPETERMLEASFNAV